MYKKEFLYSWLSNTTQALLDDKVGFSQECKVGIIFENQLVLFTIITIKKRCDHFTKFSKNIL